MNTHTFSYSFRLNANGEQCTFKMKPEGKKWIWWAEHGDDKTPPTEEMNGFWLRSKAREKIARIVAEEFDGDKKFILSEVEKLSKKIDEDEQVKSIREKNLRTKNAPEGNNKMENRKIVFSEPAISGRKIGWIEKDEDGKISFRIDDNEEINPDLWKIPEWKDIPPEELDMKKLFEDTLSLIKKLVVFQKEIEYKIYVLWIFSTWKLEAWDTVGFPVFIGMPDSGKTRALRIIHKLAYRTLKASGTTQAVIPRLCHYYNITLLIDEAHAKLNPRTESGARLLEFVKDSYKKGAVYIVSDNNDQQKVIVTRNFGFKAFAGEKSFNPSLLTRSLPFWMDKAEPEIAKLSYVEEELGRIQTALLNYRFKTDNPPDLGNNFELRGRVREIFESIIATGKHIGIPVDDIIEYARNRVKEEFEALKDTPQYEILTILKKGEETPFSENEINRISTDTILIELGWFNENSKEALRNRQKLGYIFKDMGLKTKVEKDGRFLYYNENEDRLKQLYRRFKL